MTTMAKIHIWYGMSGEILAVGQPIGKVKCLPLAGANQNVIETEIDEAELAMLHETHRIDPLKKQAVRR